MRRCLEKDPKRRLRDISEARFLIESSPDVEPTPATNRNWKLIAGGFAVIAAVAIVFIAALSLNINRSTQDQAAPLLRFSIPQPESGAIGVPAISPDGRFLAFTGVGKTNGLGIRRLDSLEIRELPGTDGATLPFWSPDSRFLGFFDGRDLKTIEVGAPGRQGTALTICPAPEARGGAWNREGDLSADGQRFLVLVPEPAPPPSTVVIVNWRAADDYDSHNAPSEGQS